MPQLRRFSDSPRYRNFVHQRDKALEALHTKTQLEISDILRGAFQRVLETVNFAYTHMEGEWYFTNSALKVQKVLEDNITHIFGHAGSQILISVQRLRKNAYLLARAGEAEALARARGKPARVTIDRDKLHAVMTSQTPMEEDLGKRIQLAMNRIKRDIMDALELARVYEEDNTTALQRVRDALPGTRRVIQPKKLLKRIHEAQPPTTQRDAMVFGFISPDDWSDMVDSYASEFVPKHRSLSKAIDVEVGDQELEEWHAWEIEQQVTHDFVDQVRSGQMDAANENGIKDFIWLAVIDNKTDDCCLWRDGLTTSEIESMLGSEHSDDECDGIVPPIHMNCRCRLVPATEDLPDQPPQESIGEFDEWLQTTPT